MLTVPLLTPRLSSAWLALVTDVDLATARNLVDSMTTEVVVRDRSIEAVVPLQPMGYDEAVRAALAERGQPAGAGGDQGGDLERRPMSAPASWRQRLNRLTAAALVERCHAITSNRTRHSGAGGWWSRLVLVLGAVLLGCSLSVRPGRPGLLPADRRAGRGLGAGRLRLRTAAPGPDQLAGLAAPAGRHADRDRPGVGSGVRGRRAGGARDRTVARLHRAGAGACPAWLVAAARRAHPAQRGHRGDLLSGRAVCRDR